MAPRIGGLHHSSACAIAKYAGQGVVGRETLCGPICDVRKIQVVSKTLRSAEVAIYNVGGDQSAPIGTQAIHLRGQVIRDSLLHAGKIAAYTSVHQSRID